MLRERLKVILPVCVLIGGAIASWLIIESSPALKTVPPQKSVPQVTVLKVKPERLRLTVNSQGIVAARDEIELISELAGKIVHMHPNFVTGGFFGKGEVLLKIDSRDYDYAIVHAEAQLFEAKRLLATEEAQADQARNEWNALGEGEATPLAVRKPQLAEARAKLKAAEANFIQAKIKRTRCIVTAPFNGRFQNKLTGLGQFIQSGDKLARIYATDIAEVRLPIGTDQLAFINLPETIQNQFVTNRSATQIVTLSAELAGQLHRWQGQIVRTEGKLDETTGAMYLVAQIKAPFKAQANQLPLFNGLFVQAEIPGKTFSDVFVVPPIALKNSREVLLVDAKQNLHIQPVTILRHETDRVLISAGLRMGDQVILSGVQLPVEGMAVTPDASGK